MAYKTQRALLGKTKELQHLFFSLDLTLDAYRESVWLGSKRWMDGGVDGTRWGEAEAVPELRVGDPWSRGGRWVLAVETGRDSD
jgi:hypothetical protein